MIPTYSKDLPKIPEDIARKAYDVHMFFQRQGHNVWAYHHLCSRDFVDAEVARVTKENQEARSKLYNIWVELDSIFNPRE